MTSFPSLITAPLPPANGSSIGESLHHPAFQGMPWKAGHHENWGIFNRRFWGVYVRHSQIDVVTVLREEIHHRHALDRQIEGGLGRIGRAVHEEQDAVRPILLHARVMLVSDEEIDAGIAGGNRVALRLDLRRLGLSADSAQRDHTHTGKARGNAAHSPTTIVSVHLNSP